MGSGESRDEFVYDGFSEDNDDNNVVLHLGHWHQDVKHLIKKLFEDPRDCRLIDKKRSAYLWELKHLEDNYEVYFSVIDYQGWNFALEIAGPASEEIVYLESTIISTLKQIGAEMSPRICEEDEYEEIEKNSHKPIYFL